MQSTRHNTRSLLLAICPLAAFVLASASGCTFHRNLLLRWHLEFDADSICDDEVPCSADDRCRCDKCSRLGRGVPEVVGHPGPTPAQMGHARFHPLPTRPVFPEPDGSDLADMGPPAPEWYLRQNEPLQQPGRIQAEPSIPAPDLEEIEVPSAPLPRESKRRSPPGEEVRRSARRQRSKQSA